MKARWLLICNATKACIYDITRGKKPILLHTLLHPKGRMKDSELVNYQMGQFGPNGEGQGVHVPHTDPHETELQHFSQEIVAFLSKEQAKRSFEELILCAEPHFQGLLNKSLSEQLKKVVSSHILKDYLPLPDDDLEKAVEKIQQENV